MMVLSIGNTQVIFALAEPVTGFAGFLPDVASLEQHSAVVTFGTDGGGVTVRKHVDLLALERHVNGLTHTAARRSAGTATSLLVGPLTKSVRSLAMLAWV